MPDVLDNPVVTHAPRLLEMNPSLTDDMVSNAVEFLAQGADPTQLTLYIFRMPAKPETRVGDPIPLVAFDPIKTGRKYGAGYYWARVRGPSKYKGGGGMCLFNVDPADIPADLVTQPMPLAPRATEGPRPDAAMDAVTKLAERMDRMMELMSTRQAAPVPAPVAAAPPPPTSMVETMKMVAEAMSMVRAMTPQPSAFGDIAKGLAELRTLAGKVGFTPRDEEERGGGFAWIGDLVKKVGEEALPTLVKTWVSEIESARSQSPANRAPATTSRAPARATSRADTQGDAGSGGGGPDGGGAGGAAEPAAAEAGAPGDHGAPASEAEEAFQIGHLGEFAKMLAIGAGSNADSERYAQIICDFIELGGPEASSLYLTTRPDKIIELWIEASPRRGGVNILSMFKDFIVEVERLVRVEVAQPADETLTDEPQPQEPE